MNRGDCVGWMARRCYPMPPKSSCLGCPLHVQAQWQEIKRSPEWADTVAVDHAIRRGVKGREQFMHRDRVPLDQADLSTAEDRGQLNLFINECEGMCGV